MGETANQLSELLQQLKLPEKTVHSLSFCDDNHESLERFVRKLPHTNPAEVLQRLYVAVPELAAIVAPPGKKLNCLDALAETALTYSHKLTAKSTFSEKTSKTYTLCLALLRHLACGYKSVAVEAANNNTTPPQLLTKALYSALFFHTRMLVLCWSTHLPAPKGLWRETHTLFQIARLCGLATTQIRASRLSEQSTDSIEQVYLAILMLGTMDPFGKTSLDLQHLYRFFDQHAELIKLGTRSMKGLFVVDPDKDDAPSYASKNSHAVGTLLAIDPTSLVEHLNTDGDNELPVRLKKLILRYCSIEVLRKDQHLPDDGSATTVLGLSRIHHLISKCASVETFVMQALGESKPAQKPHPKNATELSGEFSVTEKSGRWLRDVARNPNESIDFNPTGVSPVGKEGIKAHKVKRINKSDRGARLLFETSGLKVEPGELIAMRLDNGERWQLGIIRWSRTDNAGLRTVGIEYLSGRPVACALALVKADQNTSPYFPALLFKTVDTDPILLTPSMPFVKGSRVRVISSGNSYISQLVTQTEATYHISGFTLHQGSGA